MPSKKTNPHPPKFPGAKRPRPDLYSFRKKEAEERKEKHDALSVEEKIAKLDVKLGAGEGAKRERERLAKQLRERDEAKARSKEEPKKRDEKKSKK